MRLPFRRKAKYDPDEPVIAIKRFMVDEMGAVEADLTVEPDVVATLFSSLALFVSEAPNYTETSITISPKGKAEAYTVTVQKRSGKTPHELRREAEAEADRMRAVVEAAKAVSREFMCCENYAERRELKAALAAMNQGGQT